MTLQEKYTAATAEYLRRLQYNNLSPRTAINYTRVLNTFGEYLTTQSEDADLYEVVESWRDALTTGGAMPSTVKQYLVTLSVAFEKMKKRSFPADLRFPENPVDEDFIPKVTKKPYNNLLDDRDIIKLWNPDPPAGAHCVAAFWARNHAIVCLILATGLRNSEVRNLKLSDISWDEETITVTAGKGDKYRIVDAPAIVLESIKRYLRSGIRPDYLSDDDYLFGNTSTREFGKIENRTNAEEWHPFSVEGLSKLIERHIQNVCGDDTLQIRSHDLRHLYARLHLNVHGNISELQSSLGHSSPNVTQIYAGMVAPRRSRASARSVIDARDTAAECLKRENERGNKQ